MIAKYRFPGLVPLLSSSSMSIHPQKESLLRSDSTDSTKKLASARISKSAMLALCIRGLKLGG